MAMAFPASNHEFNHTIIINRSYHRAAHNLDWKKIASIDIEKLIAESDTETLEEIIPQIAFCQPDIEFDNKNTDPGFRKVFKLSQLIIGHLIENQEKIMDTAKMTEQRNSAILLNNRDQSDELKKLREKLIRAKKELKRKNEMIVELNRLSMLVEADAKAKDERPIIQVQQLHHCPYCPKKFSSSTFLLQHQHRRHQGLPTNLVIGQFPILSTEIKPSTHQSLPFSPDSVRLSTGQIPKVTTSTSCQTDMPKTVWKYIQPQLETDLIDNNYLIQRMSSISQVRQEEKNAEVVQFPANLVRSTNQIPKLTTSTQTDIPKPVWQYMQPQLENDLFDNNYLIQQMSFVSQARPEEKNGEVVQFPAASVRLSTNQIPKVTTSTQTVGQYIQQQLENDIIDNNCLTQRKSFISQARQEEKNSQLVQFPPDSVRSTNQIPKVTTSTQTDKPKIVGKYIKPQLENDLIDNNYPTKRMSSISQQVRQEEKNTKVVQFPADSVRLSTNQIPKATTSTQTDKPKTVEKYIQPQLEDDLIDNNYLTQRMSPISQEEENAEVVQSLFSEDESITVDDLRTNGLTPTVKRNKQLKILLNSSTSASSMDMKMESPNVEIKKVNAVTVEEEKKAEVVQNLNKDLKDIGVNPENPGLTKQDTNKSLAILKSKRKSLKQKIVGFDKELQKQNKLSNQITIEKILENKVVKARKRNSRPIDHPPDGSIIKFFKSWTNGATSNFNTLNRQKNLSIKKPKTKSSKQNQLKQIPKKITKNRIVSGAVSGVSRNKGPAPQPPPPHNRGSKTILEKKKSKSIKTFFRKPWGKKGGKEIEEEESSESEIDYGDEEELKNTSLRKIPPATVPPKMKPRKVTYVDESISKQGVIMKVRGMYQYDEEQRVKAMKEAEIERKADEAIEMSRRGVISRIVTPGNFNNTPPHDSVMRRRVAELNYERNIHNSTINKNKEPIGKFSDSTSSFSEEELDSQDEEKSESLIFKNILKKI